MNILKIYHYVVWKTAGDNKWTLRRNPGECNTIPYLPHMLLGNHMKMEAETVLGSTRTALVEETDLSSGVIRAIVNSEELPQVTVKLREFQSYGQPPRLDRSGSNGIRKWLFAL